MNKDIFIGALKQKDDLALGRYIRAWRIKYDLKQKHLAQEVGISQTQLSNIEHGLSPVSVFKLKSICKAIAKMVEEKRK